MLHEKQLLRQHGKQMLLGMLRQQPYGKHSHHEMRRNYERQMQPEKQQQKHCELQKRNEKPLQKHYEPQREMLLHDHEPLI
jgi:bisphosphoglycerate-dependent phosphoglycerate mutase